MLDRKRIVRSHSASLSPIGSSHVRASVDRRPYVTGELLGVRLVLDVVTDLRVETETPRRTATRFEIEVPSWAHLGQTLRGHPQRLRSPPFRWRDRFMG